MDPKNSKKRWIKLSAAHRVQGYRVNHPFKWEMVGWAPITSYNLVYLQLSKLAFFLIPSRRTNNLQNKTAEKRKIVFKSDLVGDMLVPRGYSGPWPWHFGECCEGDNRSFLQWNWVVRIVMVTLEWTALRKEPNYRVKVKLSMLEVSWTNH